jgi:hypothetical protein
MKKQILLYLGSAFFCFFKNWYYAPFRIFPPLKNKTTNVIPATNMGGFLFKNNPYNSIKQ